MTGIAVAIGALGSTLTTAPVQAILPLVGWRGVFGLLAAVTLSVSLWILIFVSAFASHEFSFKETALSAIVLSILGWVVFAKGLELQMAVWPKFLTQ